VSVTYLQLWRLLEQRFPKKEYAFLAEVRSTTGFSARVRSADAIALSLWPSRGLALHGIEVKQSRSDWKREAEQPAKAEEIARFCDYWWLAITDEKIAPLDEVPEPWGILAPSKDGSSLRAIRSATKLEAQPLTKGFIAAILRRASETMEPKALQQERIDEAFRRGHAAGIAQTVENRELVALRELAARVAEFEAASGIEVARKWGYGSDPKVIGAAVAQLVQGKQSLNNHLARLGHFRDVLTDSAEQASKMLTDLTKAHEQIHVAPEASAQRSESATRRTA
jgi:hypothetical protein